MSNNSIDHSAAWAALVQHQDMLQGTTIGQLFQDDPKRFETHHLTLGGVLFDYSKQRVSDETISLLCDLARSVDLETQRDAMFSGAVMNTTEGRAVLHTALRSDVPDDLTINDVNIADFVHDTRAQIKRIGDDIRGNAEIIDVVNIGVGGSDLGPHVLCDALAHHADGPNLHFIANIDGVEIESLLAKLNPANTVFIVASKTFSTFETMLNAAMMRDWIIDALGEDAVKTHFYAVTMNADAAIEFGVDADNILPLRNWIGGRFSVWGAIGLPIAIAHGYDVFDNFLCGGAMADTHFRETPFEKNIPVLMALIGVWNINFWNYHSQAILPYAQSLQGFPSLIQQLDMESNGKSVDKDGKPIDYATVPITFGDCGTSGQHAFFQSLHQGTHIIPADFIAILHADHDLDGHHAAMLGNALAQSQALMDGQANKNEPHRHFEGKRPSSTFLLDRLDAYHLGILLALYEHKVFVQGVIWNINSFDQWGVELGKELATPLNEAIQARNTIETPNESTNGLLAHILDKFIKS